MKELITKLDAGRELDAGELKSAVKALVSPEVDDIQKAAFLKAFTRKQETAAEIAGLVDCLLEYSLRPEIEPGALPGPLIDVCGTGGDRLELLNVSTTAMFILASAGLSVVKHGNRGVSSKCGGADVLEALGVRIDLDPAAAGECLKSTGACFLFAQQYHPAFKHIGPVRKQLAAEGITTVFNLLGPLLNPARPPLQLIGIYDRARLQDYAAVLQRLGRERAWVVHGRTSQDQGMDELSIEGPTEVLEVTPEGISGRSIEPAALNFPSPDVAALAGGDAAHNARLLQGILCGEVRGSGRDLVLLNAAAALVVGGISDNLEMGLSQAAEEIDSGRAIQKLEQLRNFTG